MRHMAEAATRTATPVHRNPKGNANGAMTQVIRGRYADVTHVTRCFADVSRRFAQLTSLPSGGYATIRRRFADVSYTIAYLRHGPVAGCP